MLRLAYGSLVIAAEGEDEAPLRWLAEFLGGPFETPPPGAPADHAIRVEIGPLPAAAGPGEEIDVFSLDGGFVRLPARRAPDGELEIRDEASQVVYLVRGPDVTIVAPEDGRALRLALLRVARELATAHALREGWLHLHAAAADSGGAVVAISGPRESGKTTLLLHALLDGKARYVTNDRLLIDLGKEPPSARGMPTIVSLREETLARFPGFGARLRASAFARERTLEEARSATGYRMTLSPIQLRTLAEAEESAKGPLRAVVFPAVERDVERFRVRVLPEEEAAARLRRGLFLSALPERPATAFGGGAFPRDGATLDRLCRDLARRIRCLDVRLGPKAYATPSVWSAILQ